MRLVILPVRPGTGEKDVPVCRPTDHVVVDQFTAIVAIQTLYLAGDAGHGSIQRRTDVFMRIIAHRFQLNPACHHVGQCQGSGKLSLQGRAAVRHRVRLKEARLQGNFVSRFPDFDAVSEQDARLGGTDAFQAQTVTLRFQIPVHCCRAHAEQFFAYLFCPAVLTQHPFPVGLQRPDPAGQVGHQVLPAGHTHDAPQPEQHLLCFRAVFARPTPSSVHAQDVSAAQRRGGQVPPGRRSAQPRAMAEMIQDSGLL